MGIEATIKKVTKNGLDIRLIEHNERRVCAFKSCGDKAQVLMEGFYICEKHALVLLKNFIPRRPKPE